MIWSITAKFLKWCKTDLPFAQHRSCQFLHQGWLSRDQWGPDCWQSPGQLWSARGVTLRETSLVNLLNGIISSWTLNKKRLSYKKLLFFCQKKEVHLVICASIFLIDEMLSLWLSLCDWDESLKMVAISIPGIPGYSQSPHSRTTLQSVWPLQARADQSEARQATLANQRSARCGPWDHCQHGQHFQSPDFFLIPDKTWVCCFAVIPWTWCVLHSSSHVKFTLSIAILSAINKMKRFPLTTPCIIRLRVLTSRLACELWVKWMKLQMLIGVVSKLCLSRRSVIRRKGISIHWKVTNAWSLLALPVDRQPFMPFMENEVWIDNTATPLALTEKAVYICDSKWLIIAPFITSLNKMTEWRSNLRLILCSVFKCWIHFKTRQNSKFLLFNYLFVGFHQQHSHLRNNWTIKLDASH